MYKKGPLVGFDFKDNFVHDLACILEFWVSNWPLTNLGLPLVLGLLHDNKKTHHWDITS